MAAGPMHAAPVDPGVTDSERTYTIVTHLVGLLAALPGVGTISVIATLCLWRVRHEESGFLDDHGRDATNFQISVLLYSIAFTVLAVPAPPLGVLGVVAVGALTIVGCVRGALAAGRSEYYRYPASLRFIKSPDESAPAEQAAAY